jgi:hypothetical protein
MKMRLIGLLAISAFCGGVYAEPVPGPSGLQVARLFEQADVVCNCLTESIQTQSDQGASSDGTSFTLRHNRATVQIQDLYKGTGSPGDVLTVNYDDVSKPTPATPFLRNGGVGILFLKRTGPSEYTFLDRFVGATPFTSIPLQTDPLGVKKLEAALVGILRQPDPDDQVNAMHLLEGSSEFHVETISQLAALSASPSPDIAQSAISVLLKADPAAGVNSLQNYLISYEEDEQHHALTNLGSELGTVRDASTEPSLELLLSSKFLVIRLGAINAIRNLKQARSASALVQRLDDPNETMQFFAVKSLAGIFGKKGDYDPPTPVFDKNPDFYTNLWKQWWAQHASTPQ